MIAANFTAVFLGIETPDTDSLTLTHKFQNTHNSLIEAVQTINQKGLRVMAGFIIGFDSEKPGAGQRIIDFVELTASPQAMFGMLIALPNTALWQRLKQEGRLLEGKEETQGSQMSLPNFIPSRPIEDIVREYVSCFWELYEPSRYLSRVFRHFMEMSSSPHKTPFRMLRLNELRAVLIIFWRRGFKRRTRLQFWRQLYSILRRNRSWFVPYLSACALNEHFIDYRQIVRHDIETQLAEYLAAQAKSEMPEPPKSAVA